MSAEMWAVLLAAVKAESLERMKASSLVVKLVESSAVDQVGQTAA